MALQQWRIGSVGESVICVVIHLDALREWKGGGRVEEERWMDELGFLKKIFDFLVWFLLLMRKRERERELEA